MDGHKLLSDLVRIPSVNPREQDAAAEAEIAAFTADWLSRAGLQVEMQPVLPGRPNVVARLPGRDRSRTLLLECHMDTVETGGMTGDPFSGEIRGGRLYGRGACDAKATLASMMVAVAEVARSEPPPVDVALAAVMDEEFQFRGVTALLERGTSFAGAIVGEPTELEVVVAHKGVVRFFVHADGTACHSSAPWSGDNAIYRMTDVIQWVRREIEPELASRVHPRVGPASISVTVIEGGTGVNIVPARCTIQIDRRTIPGEDSQAVWKEYRERFEAFDPGRVSVSDPFTLDYALDTDAECQVAQALSKAARDCGCSGKICGVNYGTDASKLARAGIPSVVFGAGSIAQAHVAEEFVDLSQVDLASRILVRAIRSFQ